MLQRHGHRVHTGQQGGRLAAFGRQPRLQAALQRQHAAEPEAALGRVVQLQGFGDRAVRHRPEGHLARHAVAGGQVHIPAAAAERRHQGEDLVVRQGWQGGLGHRGTSGLQAGGLANRGPGAYGRAARSLPKGGPGC